MAPGQQIPLKPTLTLVLAQHRIKHLALGRQEFIILYFPRVPLSIGDLEYRPQQVRECLVGTKYAEITLPLIEFGYVAQESPQHLGIVAFDGARRGHMHRVVMKVRHSEIMQQQAAIGMGVGAHPPIAFRRKLLELRDESAARIEQFLGFIALHPGLEQRHVIEMVRVHEHRHLMRPEGALDLEPVDEFRSGPTFRRFQHDHRPSRTRRVAGAARMRLDAPDIFDRGFHHGRHALMHGVGIIAFDEKRRPAATAQELFQFLALNAREHRGIADLIAIQMQDRQHRPIRHGV